MSPKIDMNKSKRITAWHGTNISNLDSIIKYGLKPPGIKLEDGTFTPKTKYIPDKELVHEIRNWENAIFASGNIYTAASYSSDRCVLEVKIKENSDNCKSYTYYPDISAFCRPPEQIALTVGNDEYKKYPEIIGNDEYRRESPKNIVVDSIVFIKY